MLWFGGTITLNNVVCYIAYNADKVLLGRFWGADALGIYGRAYQLINLPTENLNSTLGIVAFPALSRVQHDPKRLRRYFLQGYSLILAITVPITIECALFSDDVIRVALGPQWSAAAKIFRLLAPTILAFAILNPLAWLMLALGQAVKSLKIALLSAPIVILGYAIGISRGPHGVAAGYSLAMLLLIVPLVTWAKHGTLITWNDILKAVGIPFLSVAVGAGVIWLLRGTIGPIGASITEIDRGISHLVCHILRHADVRLQAVDDLQYVAPGHWALGRRTAPKRGSAINELAASKAQRCPAAVWWRGTSEEPHQVPA